MRTVARCGGIIPRQSGVPQLRFRDRKFSGLSPAMVFAFLRLAHQLPLLSEDMRQKIYLTCCLDEAEKAKSVEGL